MPDHFEQRLRDGAGQFAADLAPLSADRVRARGDQRRHRKLAGSLAVALLVIAGGGGTAYALGQPQHPAPAESRPVPTATTAPSPPPSPAVTPPASATASPGTTGSPGATGHATAGTTTLRFGPLVLRVPDGWRITYHDARGDYTVSTGSCTGSDEIEAAAGSPCPTFSLIADVGPRVYGAQGPQTYVPGQPWNPSNGVVSCPASPAGGVLRDSPTTPFSSGYAAVTSARTADYTVWRFGCLAAPRSPPVFYFQQRDWYLPVEKILIVDEYSTPGLAQILAAATWAG